MLLVVGPELLGRAFPLRQGSYVLGRAKDADLQLQLETISRRHALVTVSGEEVIIEDLQSRYGTFVNGKRIESVAIAIGARIVIGGLTLKLVVDS